MQFLVIRMRNRAARRFERPAAFFPDAERVTDDRPDQLRPVPARPASTKAVDAYVDRLLVIDEGRYDFGPVETVLTADHLRRIYQVPVVVEKVAGASVVVVPR